MQSGTIGLRRIGANMLRHLSRGGHNCVVRENATTRTECLVPDWAEGRWTLAR